MYSQSTSLTNSKWEQTQAFQWIRNNLEECDSTINLPKHEVYDDYKYVNMKSMILFIN